MKKTCNIFSIAFLLLIYIALLNFTQFISLENKKINTILTQLAENEISIGQNTFSITTTNPLSEIKVNFWKIDPETSQKGEYLGFKSSIFLPF